MQFGLSPISRGTTSLREQSIENSEEADLFDVYHAFITQTEPLLRDMKRSYRETTDFKGLYESDSRPLIESRSLEEISLCLHQIALNVFLTSLSFKHRFTKSLQLASISS